MIDLNKFKDESKKMKMPEAAVYLLRKFQAMHDDTNSLVQLCLKHLAMSCRSVITVGGSATEEFVDTVAKPSMYITASMNVEGASPVTIKTVKCEMGKVVIVFSADPGNDHQLTYHICK